MWRRRALLVCLTAFLGAAGQPVAEPDRVTPPVLPSDQPPFGLACSECSLAPEAACSVLWTSPVVAEARGAVIRTANRQCYRLSRDPGAAAMETCDIVESVTFAQLHYFRASPQPVPDRFRVFRATGDVHADEAGIVLVPERRYVLFAAPSDGALTMTAACPIDEARRLE